MDRQTKLDSTMSSVSPERLEATRQEIDMARQKLDNKAREMYIEPADEDIISAPSLPPMHDRMQVIQDVQLILVDKYRRGTNFMLGAVALLVVGTAGIFGIYLKNLELYASIRVLQVDQQKLIDSQRDIAKTQDQIERNTDETKVSVEATKKKVDESIDSAPKIEIDSAGKAKVVLPVKSSDPRAPLKSPLGAHLPVETKKF